MLMRLAEILGIANSQSEADVDFRLALDFQKRGLLQEAEAGYLKVLRSDPRHAPAMHFQGILLCQANRHEEGMRLIKQSIALRPDMSPFHANLGAIYGQLNKHDAAANALLRAVQISPSSWEARFNLGVALEALGQKAKASTQYQEAYRNLEWRSQPDPVAHSRLAQALARTGNLTSAIAIQQEIAASADSYKPLAALCEYYELAGDLAKCVDAQQTLLGMEPASARTHSAFLYGQLHVPDRTSDQLFSEHRSWFERHGKTLPQNPCVPDRSINRRLRVGYLSANFHNTPVPRFFELILDAHDSSEFEITCYSDGPIHDEVAQRIQQKSERWRRTHGFSDHALQKLIREDAIDILVDLTGHMAENRMGAMAARLAPLQISYLYPHTTGIDAIDVRLTDHWVDLPGYAEQFSTEQIVRLGPSAWCYRPAAGPIQVSQLPALATGSVTFGSLNRMLKINDQVLDVYAEILRLIPRSRLLLLIEYAGKRDWICEHFERRGVKSSRIDTPIRGTHGSYLELCRRIDIALDPFPYCGHTTTFDMFWMGVPIVSLAGQTHVSRVGVNLLANVGLPELVASHPLQYVQKAVELASDLSRLRKIRSTLRERMRYSPLMDESGLTRRIEQTYRNVWRLRLLEKQYSSELS